MPASGKDRSFVRVLLMTLLAGPTLIILAWLVTFAAWFVGIVESYGGHLTAWDYYPLRTSAGILVPPLLVAGLGHGPDTGTRFIEAGRAALVVFLFYCLVFFALCLFIGRTMEAMSGLLLPRLLLYSGPAWMLLLLAVSYHLAVTLLPQPVAQGPRPAAMKVFGVLAFLLLGGLLFMIHVADLPAGLPGLEEHLAMSLSRPQGTVLLLMAVWLLLVRGQRLFRPVFALLCLSGPLLMLAELPQFPPEWQVLVAVHALVAVAAVVCLYRPASTEWLV